MKSFLKLALTSTVSAVCATAVFAMSSSAGAPSADEQQRRQTAQMTAQANQDVGMPAIKNFQEKRMVKMLYELRDDPNFQTWSYIVTMDGGLIDVCDGNPSVGFGINASIQYSNPMKIVDTSRMSSAAGPDVVTLPQQEPNALSMPEGLAATYVLCLVGEEIMPVYVEPNVLVSPFKREASS